MKKPVKINMEESDIALLDIQAKEKGISRADLVRDRLFASNGARGIHASGFGSSCVSLQSRIQSPSQ